MSESSITSSVKSKPGLTPVQPTKRIEAVDVMRGFTLFGVLIANMGVFSIPVIIGSQGVGYWTDPLDRTAELVVKLLAIGEFYVPFSFLFGWGLAVQMERAASRGTGFASVYLRRLLILLLFGLVHTTLIWYGDILVTYTVLGFLLLLCRKLPNRVLLVAIVVCLLLSVLISAPGPLGEFRQNYDQAVSGIRQEAWVGHQSNVYASGDYLRITAQRIKDTKSSWVGVLYWGPYVFGLFLLGLYVGRRGFLQDIQSHLPLFRKTLWIGLLVGLPLTVLYISTLVSPPNLIGPEWVPAVQRGTRIYGGLGLCAFYFSAIILLLQKESWRQRLAPLIPVGRMTLTNYLVQSIVCTMIFYGYGLGLYGKIGPAIGLIFSVILFFAQIRFSEWWTDRYRFGLMEWLWRTLTYLKPQPMVPEGDERVPWGRRNWLTLVGAVALVLAGVLGWWWMNQEDGLPQMVIDLPQLQPTAQPAASQATPVPSPTPIRTPVAEPVTRTPSPAAAQGDLWALGMAFDVEQAQAEIEALASTRYVGRKAGTAEGRAAGDYIAQRFADAGLRPAGMDGTYFQPFPVLDTSLAEMPQLAVTGPDGTTKNYVFRQDYATVVRYYSGGGAAEGPVIWVHDGEHDDYNNVDAEGKVVLCRETLGRWNDQARAAMEHGAVALLLLADTQAYPIDLLGSYREIWVPAPMPTLRVTPAVAQDLLAGSSLTLDDLSIHFASTPLSTTARLDVALQINKDTQARNVLGVLPGRDPAYADEVVIVGAHCDHMGQDPDGTFWPGADDNASGVATVIEIARSWQEQGYVPRRTVLFAAWDAEELGLLGSYYYVAHPQYPLTATVAVLNLDMVGGRDEPLLVEGTDSLNSRFGAIAQTLGISITTSTNPSGSDHVPFLQASVPAELLIWVGWDRPTVQEYHRPMDTASAIQIQQLAVAGRVADLGLLALVEGDLAFQDLLQARTAALVQGDMDAYLRTSSPARQAADRTQFETLRALDPIQFDITAPSPVIVGRAATTTVQVQVEYVYTAGVTLTRSAGLPTRFVHRGADGWVWDGPALVWQPDPGDGGFAVAYPPGRGEGMAELGRLAAARYVTITNQLGLPTAIDADLVLYPSQQALWADTTFPDSQDIRVWIGPASPGNTRRYHVKQVYGRPVMTDTLVHLAMTRAGVVESAAPWLWGGLPLALRAADDPVTAQSAYLPQLERGLLPTDADSEVAVPRDAADWAAVSYLQRRVGWQGIGQLITALGRGRSLDDALLDVVGVDAAGFEAAWRNDWTNRLARARDGLAAVLNARQAAVLAGDETAFMSTVDPADPNLLTEERQWFVDLVEYPLDKFALEGQVMALFDDGHLLANVLMRYQLTGQREGSVTLAVSLSPDGAGYRWAGLPLESLQGRYVVVRYPAGLEVLAQDVLVDAESAYTQLATDLRLSSATPLVVKIYGDARTLRFSTRLFLPNWTETWTGPGESIKLPAQSLYTPDTRRRTVALAMAYRLLYQLENQPEWLHEGVARLVAGRLDPVDARRAAARNWYPVFVAAQADHLYPLAEMPSFLSLPDQDRDLAYAQSWDAARYLVDTYGWSRLRALLQSLRQGRTVDDVFVSTLGISLASFETAWHESATRGHADPDWATAAWQFDPEAAQAHVTELSSPAYAGRQAGSPGGNAAAQYIATRFDDYDLIPVGDEGTYLQHVPISYTVLLAEPRLTLVGRRGQTLGELGYRQEFLPLLRGGAGGGTVEGELVWVREDDYDGMRLAGKIVLRRSESGRLADEIDAAVAHGADGLILLGEREGDRLLAKDPLPVSFAAARTIPVLEINEIGLERVLAASGHSLTELNNSPPALPMDLHVRLEVPLSPPVTISTTNVLALLPGSDPALRDEVVIVSAHYDHVGDDPDGTRYPGANDDASGVGVLLEVARLWQETGYRPARSVLFAAWGAQEAGQFGSSFYVANPTFPMTDTIAVFQLDAVGGGFGGFRLQVQGNRQNEGLPLFALEAAVDQIDGRLIQGQSTGQSDHQPFRQAGVPAVLLTWVGASEENLPAGLNDEVDPYKLGVTGRMVTLAVMMLARGDVRSPIARAAPSLVGRNSRLDFVRVLDSPTSLGGLNNAHPVLTIVRQ